MQIHGEARLDRQVPEGSEKTESASRPLYTLLVLISLLRKRYPFEPLQAAELKILFLREQLSCLLCQESRGPGRIFVLRIVPVIRAGQLSRYPETPT